MVYYTSKLGWRPTQNPSAVVIYTTPSGKPIGGSAGSSVGPGTVLGTTQPTAGGGSQTVDYLGNVKEYDAQGKLIPEKSGQVKPEQVESYLKESQRIGEENTLWSTCER